MSSVLLALLLDRHYWRSRAVVSLLSTGFLFNLAGWVWVFLVVRPTAARILLHYTVQGGVDRIGTGTLSYLIPAAALLLLILNATGGALLFRFERFLSYFLLGAAIFVQALFFVGAVTITLAAG